MYNSSAWSEPNSNYKVLFNYFSNKLLKNNCELCLNTLQCTYYKLNLLNESHPFPLLGTLAVAIDNQLLVVYSDKYLDKYYTDK